MHKVMVWQKIIKYAIKKNYYRISQHSTTGIGSAMIMFEHNLKTKLNLVRPCRYK